MDSTQEREWYRYWAKLRARRIQAAVALAAFVPLWIAFGPAGLALGFVLVALTYWHLRSWPCPRCALPVVGASFHTFVERCVCCDLLLFGHPTDVQWQTSASPRALLLSRRTRRFVAGYEIASGISLMALSALAHSGWWRITMLEGFAAMSVAAGLWLWRDEARGYVLSRSLQFAQLIRVQSAWITYVATSGVYFDLYDANGTVGIMPGFSSTFTFDFAAGRTLGIAVNLWAMLLLLVLLHARPAGEQVLVAQNAAGEISATPVA
jgi:hypothetical protein